MNKEKPYLIYPIGDFDDDPEELIRFHGISPKAVQNHGHQRARALATIEFFKLDDKRRKNLLRERAMIIVALFPQLKLAHDRHDAQSAAKAKALIDAFTSPRAPHTNCARSFRDLFLKHRAEAQAVFDGASAFVLSIS